MPLSEEQEDPEVGSMAVGHERGAASYPRMQFGTKGSTEEASQLGAGAGQTAEMHADPNSRKSKEKVPKQRKENELAFFEGGTYP